MTRMGKDRVPGIRVICGLYRARLALARLTARRRHARDVGATPDTWADPHACLRRAVKRRCAILNRVRYNRDPTGSARLTATQRGARPLAPATLAGVYRTPWAREGLGRDPDTWADPRACLRRAVKRRCAILNRVRYNVPTKASTETEKVRRQSRA